MTARRVLVSGASIAGNAAAWWLSRRSWDVTVVEQAPGFRDGGQNVDVRGAGRDVLRLMGLEQAALDATTGERGLAWVDGRDKVVARIDVDDLRTDGPTAEMEVLRGDLARLLYEPASLRAAYRFGERIAAVAQGGDAALVTFASGRQEAYELVVIAEGVGSATREMVFPGENRPRWMEMQTAFFTMARGATDTRVARWYTATGGRSAGTRPDNKGTTRAYFNLQGRARGAAGQTEAEQKAYLRACFADAGWEVPRLLAGLDVAEDFYMDELRQVKMARWSNGRVVLLGDAAWCVTPLGGVGATLAIIGAHVLCGELSRGGETGVALAAYERILRPLVTKSQDVPKFVPRFVHPRTRVGIAGLHAVQRVLTLPGIRDLVVRAMTPAARAFALPDYG